MMKNLLSLIIAVAFTFTGAFAQVASIGVIGTGSPNGNWDEDVDLTQSSMDTAMWSGTMTLQAGQVKFRANDDWAYNLGGDAAALEADGGNLSVAADGNYTITLSYDGETYTSSVN